MACSNCKTSNCGCSNTYVVSATCPPSCSEVFNAQCIVYTGVDILCGTDTVIARNDYLDTVITKLAKYICDNKVVTTERQRNVGYSSGAAAATITHTVGETYVAVRTFNNLVDVTPTTTVTLVNDASFTIANASNNITELLILG